MKTIFYDKLTVEEFIVAMQKELELFKQQWRSAANENDSEIYPDSMPMADWEEQFYFWNNQINEVAKD